MWVCVCIHMYKYVFCVKWKILNQLLNANKCIARHQICFNPLRIFYKIILIMFFLKYIGPWRAWCCQLAWAWRIYKSEKYSNYRTWEIWNRNMVFLSLSTRIQWLSEAVLLWVLPQFHEAERTASEAYGELFLNHLSPFSLLE